MPTIPEIEADIARIESSLSQFNLELDHLVMEVGRALSPTAGEWMKKHVQGKIEDHAIQLNTIGMDAIRAIKVDFEALVETLPNICEEALGSASEWPHNLKNNDRFSQSSSRTFADACFRRAVSNLGSLLAKHSIISSKTGHAHDWEHSGNSNYRYAFNPGFNEQKIPVLSQYQAKHAEQQKLLLELDKKRQELEKAKVLDLWDKA